MAAPYEPIGASVQGIARSSVYPNGWDEAPVQTVERPQGLSQ